MRVGVIDKHGAPIPLLSLIRTLTVGLRVSLSQPPIGYVRVADYNRRFEITSTPITTSTVYYLSTWVEKSINSLRSKTYFSRTSLPDLIGFRH